MEEQYKNYYEILEISYNAQDNEIRDGYLRAKNAYSGESVAMYSLLTSDECQKVLEQIEEAYSVLGIPEKRREYDRVRSIPNGGRDTHFEMAKNKIDDSNKKKKKQFEEEKDFKISGQNSISRLGVGHKFKLEYKIDPMKEQNIENIEMFSGPVLKDIREYKNVTLDKISEWTKISRTYLRHLEQNDYDKLPAIAFVRGFVYQYARCLKLNPETTSSSYIQQMKEHLAKEKK